MYTSGNTYLRSAYTPILAYDILKCHIVIKVLDSKGYEYEDVVGKGSEQYLLGRLSTIA
jgi:hypothetical protein